MVIDSRNGRTGGNDGGNKGGRGRTKDGKIGRGIIIGYTSGSNSESASDVDG